MFLRNTIYKSDIYNWSLRGSVPVRTRGTPPDPWSGEADAGSRVLEGNHVLYGQSRHLGDLPWKNNRLSDAERRLLHRFEFLGDLKALGDDDAQAKGRELMTRWINEYGRWHSIAWEPAVTGKRLTNWFRTYDFLKNPDHPGFDLTFLESSATQLRHLSRTVTDTADDVRAIEAAEGLILGAMCLVGMEALLDTGLAALEVAITRQILPDGGHFQRNPAIQRSVLTSMVRIRDTMIAGQVDTPFWLQHAIDRLAPMLHAMRHSDGKLALFNGSAEGNKQAIDSILKIAGSSTKGLWSAPHTGFQRIESGSSVIIADAGAGVFSGANRDAHAGLLSFEFSHKRNRIIVNCGSHANRDDDWHEALRATAAHSTLTLNDTNAVEALVEGPPKDTRADVSCRRNEAEGSTFLQLRQNGYVRPFGLIHNRDIYLAAGGDDLRGRDSLAMSPNYMGPQASTFCVRFHLHPDVSAEIAGGGDSAILKVSKREGWRLRSSGGEMSVEDSAYLGVAGIVRRARQIMISGPCKSTGMEVKWSLIKESS
jgi:uncharacterized heparinase superfamily protein